MRCPYRFCVEMKIGVEQDCILGDCYACEVRYLEYEDETAYICNAFNRLIKVEKGKV